MSNGVGDQSSGGGGGRDDVGIGTPVMSLPPDPESVSFICRRCLLGLTATAYAWSQAPTCRRCGGLMERTGNSTDTTLRTLIEERRFTRHLTELDWEIEVGAWRGVGVRSTLPTDPPEAKG